MIIFYNLQEDKILSNQHLSDASMLKVLRLMYFSWRYFIWSKKTLYQVLSYYIPIELKVVLFFIFVGILFIQQEKWLNKIQSNLVLTHA